MTPSDNTSDQPRSGRQPGATGSGATGSDGTRSDGTRSIGTRSIGTGRHHEFLRGGGRRTSQAVRDTAVAARAYRSRYVAHARERARRILDDPERLRRVASESAASGAVRSGPFAGVLDEFRTLVRLVVAYARGQYREVPADSLVLIVGALLYVVTPLDLLPDAIPGVGFLDDAAVVAWTIKAVRSELDAFRQWEEGYPDRSP